MRSNAWLAASVWLRLARLPPPASRVRRSSLRRDTLAAAPGLLAHPSVTEIVKFCSMGQKQQHIIALVTTLTSGADGAAMRMPKQRLRTGSITRLGLSQHRIRRHDDVYLQRNHTMNGNTSTRCLVIRILFHGAAQRMLCFLGQSIHIAQQHDCDTHAKSR
jgi:hypothetical protein